MKAIIGQKKQMTQIFAEDGRVLPVTIIDVSEVKVAEQKTMDQDGYNATVFVKGKKNKGNKAESGKFKELGYIPQFIKEIRGVLEVEKGSEINAEMFKSEDKVNVTGISKGKGFQGVVKRWGFHGGPKTHGQSDKHRAPGSIGSGTTPGRVYKGKKMGGRMGNDQTTVKNLKVVLVDKKNNLIAVKGAIPGSNGSLVVIKSV